MSCPAETAHPVCCFPPSADISINQHWHWNSPCPLAPVLFPTPIPAHALSLLLATALIRVLNSSQLKPTVQKSYLAAMLHHQEQIIVRHSASLWFLWRAIYDPFHTQRVKTTVLRKSTLASSCTSHSLGSDPFFLGTNTEALGGWGCQNLVCTAPMVSFQCLA